MLYLAFLCAMCYNILIKKRRGRMRTYLLPQGGRFYKANLHCHTTVSDGRLSPEEVKRAYMAHGYSIVAYTDHDVMIDHSELAEDGFLPLRGYEMEINESAHTGSLLRHLKTCHMCLIALDPDVTRQVCWHREKYVPRQAAAFRDKVDFDRRLPDYERIYTCAGISDMMQKGRAGGFFVTYNHPAWSREGAAEYLGYSGMHAMEICNWSGLAAGHEDYAPYIYDDMLRHGKRIYCISADDNHNNKSDPYEDSFGGFTMVKAERLEYRTIAKALLDGHFYASQGPEIHELYVEDGRVHITCSPARQISIATGARCNESVWERDGKLLTGASFQLLPDCDYFRLTVTDAEGRHANTNAYFMDSLNK